MPAAGTPATRGRTSEDEHVERLYNEYAGRILAHCIAHLGSRAEAEDACQLTFLSALRALRRGVVPRSESAWLHAIARNVCRWQQRSAARRPRLGEAGVDFVASPDANGDGELLADLRAALEALPARQRDAFLLREWRGLSPREIARELHLTTSATHALLTRARRSVAHALAASEQAAVVLVTLIVSVRAWFKSVLSGAAVQTAAATVAVVGVGTTVIAVDRTLGGESHTSLPAVGQLDTARTGLPTSALTFGSSGAVRGTGNGVRRASSTGTRVARGSEPAGTTGTRTTAPRADGPAASPSPSGGESVPVRDPSPTPRDEPSPSSERDVTELVPDVDPLLDTILDPLLADVSGDLPPVGAPEVPPLPGVEIPQVEAPQPPSSPPLPPVPPLP
jgi:RNA polymerase sigma-70 factor, ECF subfamily